MAANSTNFTPVPAPLDQKDMGRYVENELRRVAASLDYLDDAHVGGKRTETNAASFTLHDFNQDRLPNPLTDFGATGDAVANDTTAVQGVFTALYGELTKATGYLVSALTAAANAVIRGVGRSSPVKFSSTGGLQITGSYAQLENIRIDGQGTTQAIYAGAGASNVSLRGVDLTTNNAATTAHIGIQNNSTGTDDWSLIGNRFRSNGYAFLLNDGTGGIAGLITIGNYIDSRTADAFAINTPTTKFQDGAIVGNVLRSQNVGSDANSGFAFSLAQVDGVVYVGNVIKESRQQAIHIEDGSENVTVTGNVAKTCRESGIRILVGGAGNNEANARPVSVVGNQLEASAATVGEAGIYVVSDPDGTLQSCPIIGNVVRGFETGLWLGGDGQHCAYGNTVHNSTYAMRVDTGGGTRTVVEGTNFVKSCTNLLYASGATAHMISVGKFVCEDKPTNLISRTSTTRPGVDFKGFSWPQSNTLTAGVNTYVVLFPSTSTRFAGKITLRARNVAGAADNIWYSADVSYDGTTLTITNPISEYNGGLTMTSPALRINAGNLEAGFFHASAITIRIDLNFDGIYMV